MKNGKLIAVSAISSALGVVFLIIGAYFQTLDLSCLFTASLTVTFPLSKNSVKGAFLSYLSTAILALIFTISRFYVPLLFLVFFGLHPILNYLQFKDGKNLWFLYIIKCVLFLASCYLMVFAFSMFTFESEIVIKILPYLVGILGVLFFVVYDYIMVKFQRMTNQVIKRLGL